MVTSLKLAIKMPQAARWNLSKRLKSSAVITNWFK